jgi:hypothetical protein
MALLQVLALTLVPLPSDPPVALEDALATAGLPYGEFGSAVAADGSRAVVGAPKESNAAGKVYVFERSGGAWVLETSATSPAPSAGGNLGAAVALSGDTFLCGEYGSSATHAYRLSAGTWAHEALLQPPSGGMDGFGWSVDLDGDTAVVGAPFTDIGPGPDGDGMAHVFVRQGTSWTWQASLAAGVLNESYDFGRDVALSGDRAAIGANNSVYVFERTGTAWAQTKRLQPLGASGLVGLSTDLDGDTVAVGLYRSGAPGQVEAYQLSSGSWVLRDTLVASDGHAGDKFGSDLALLGDAMVVGAPAFDLGGYHQAGAAYLFTRSGTSWSEAGRLGSSDAKPSMLLGTGVALSSGAVLAGAPAVGPALQTVHVYDRPVTPVPTAIPYCTAGITSHGCSATLTAVGVPSASKPEGFWLSAANVEGQRNGLFFFGANGRQAAQWGNGTSYQCVVPPVKRAGLMYGVGTSGTCEGTFLKDLNQLWTSSPKKNPGSGAVVQAQLWFRDQANTSNQGTALSHAVEFTVLP